MNLIIVSGIPCSGKSSISKVLSKEFGYSVLSKDYFKEKLFNKYGFRSAEEKKEIDKKSEIKFYKEVEKRLNKNENLIIDKWLQGIEPLKKINDFNKANIIFIHLLVNPLEAAKRYNKRNCRNERPISFKSLNQFPITDNSKVEYEGKMSTTAMIEKAKRPFYKDGIINLLEIDTTDIDKKSDLIQNEIIHFVKRTLK